MSRRKDRDVHDPRLWRSRHYVFLMKNAPSFRALEQIVFGANNPSPSVMPKVVFFPVGGTSRPAGPLRHFPQKSRTPHRRDSCPANQLSERFNPHGDRDREMRQGK